MNIIFSENTEVLVSPVWNSVHSMTFGCSCRGSSRINLVLFHVNINLLLKTNKTTKITLIIHVLRFIKVFKEDSV